MKFKFSYQTLMREREIRRDEAERDYRFAQSKVDEQKAALKKMKDDSVFARKEMGRVRSSGGKLSSALVSYEEFIEGQKIRIQTQTKMVKGLEEIANQKREILVEASKEVKVLEKLREKRYTEFKKELRKKEMKALDEIAVIRAARERSA